jgi:hypothetical protein
MQPANYWAFVNTNKPTPTAGPTKVANNIAKIGFATIMVVTPAHNSYDPGSNFRLTLQHARPSTFVHGHDIPNNDGFTTTIFVAALANFRFKIITS